MRKNKKIPNAGKKLASGVNQKTNKFTKDIIKPGDFRQNNKAKHPAYIFGRQNKKVDYVGLTTSPKDGRHNNIELERNPNPKDSRKAYIRKRPKTDPEGVFGPKKKGWSFSNNDKSKVSSVIAKKKNKK